MTRTSRLTVYCKITLYKYSLVRTFFQSTRTGLHSGSTVQNAVHLSKRILTLFHGSLVCRDPFWGLGEGGTQSGGPDEIGDDQPGPLEAGAGGGTQSGGPVSSRPQLRALSFFAPCRLRKVRVLCDSLGRGCI
jgi:hypothetical protein